MASTRAYHATGSGIDPQRGNVWNRSPISAGVDFVCHLNSNATSFGRDVKPRSSPFSMRSNTELKIPTLTEEENF